MIFEITVVYVVRNILAQIVINQGVDKLWYLLYRSMFWPTASTPAQGLKFNCHAGFKVQVNVKDMLASW